MEREIAIYSIDIETWKPIIERSLSGNEPGVSVETLERARRFYRAEDAHRCIGAELLRIHALHHEAGLDATQCRVERDEKGKPFLPGLRDVHFNLSHSGNMILCAVDRLPVGVDVEMIRDIDPDVAESCFTSAERMRLSNREGDEWLSEFYLLWTLKESYLKALGTGLSRDPLSVEIAPIDAEELMWKANDDMVMHSLRMPEGYAGAVCGKEGFVVAVGGSLECGSV